MKMWPLLRCRVSSFHLLRLILDLLRTIFTGWSFQVLPLRSVVYLCLNPFSSLLKQALRDGKNRPYLVCIQWSWPRSTVISRRNRTNTVSSPGLSIQVLVSVLCRKSFRQNFDNCSYFIQSNLKRCFPMRWQCSRITARVGP